MNAVRVLQGGGCDVYDCDTNCNAGIHLAAGTGSRCETARVAPFLNEPAQISQPEHTKMRAEVAAGPALETARKKALQDYTGAS